ncbi:MAG TPA: hypothetical protein VL418_06435 [Devosiaceae bacterium]|nr:hypothetical protein [Devosiaceae bacterium]
MDMHAQADVAKRNPYSGFDRLPIGGEWRQGKMRALKDIDPYTDEVLLEIPQADRGDLDDAYAAAARAQRMLLLFRLTALRTVTLPCVRATRRMSGRTAWRSTCICRRSTSPSWTTRFASHPKAAARGALRRRWDTVR